jgi:hypothetical protein
MGGFEKLYGNLRAMAIEQDPKIGLASLHQIIAYERFFSPCAARTRRVVATNQTAASADNPRVNPPKFPGGRAESGRASTTGCRALRRRAHL